MASANRQVKKTRGLPPRCSLQAAQGQEDTIKDLEAPTRGAQHVKGGVPKTPDVS